MPDLGELRDLAHRHDLPLIVDAALSLPPTKHLRLFIQQGADLVTLSGGKHLGGPQASGLLFGRLDLVRSAWVQMVDMDIRPGTWSLRSWMDSGWIRRPPRNGIGRSMKVSKEAIVGVLTALERYSSRDHSGELQLWHRRIERLGELLGNLKGLSLQSLFPARNGQPFPVLRLHCQQMEKVIHQLRQSCPPVILAEDETDPQLAYIYPMRLRDEDVERIGGVFIQIFKDYIQR
jgi:L-seryl-tRNA(Ser) seleniumtransferase